MKPVTLNRLLVLEKPISAQDGAGGFQVTWQTIGSLWAEILSGAGREAGGEEITLSSVSYRIIVRGAPATSPRRPIAGYRFREGGRLFRILAVTERDTDGLYLVCFAREEEPT